MVIHWLKHGGTRFPIHGDRRWLLGRGPHCFVVLAGRRVSREHAMVRIRSGNLQVVDLGSRNGTFVNGEPIAEPKALARGDVVEVGDERLEVLPADDTELPVTLRISSGEDEPAALAYRSVLELAEELLMRATEARERAKTATTIRSMIDALLESLNRSGRKLAKGEAVRLAAVAQVVSNWLEGEDPRYWSEQVSSTLAV